MRDQTIRCPACHVPFRVEEAKEEQPPYPDDGHEHREEAGPSAKPPTAERVDSGSVGDVIPILEAEVVGQPPPPKDKPKEKRRASALESTPPLIEAELVEPSAAPETASWHRPPPVRNPHATQQAPALFPGTEFPLPESTEEAPPQPLPSEPRDDAPVAEPEPLYPAEETHPTEFDLSRRKRKRAIVVVLVMLLIAGGAIFGATYKLLSKVQEAEGTLAAQAMKEYEAERFSNARDIWYKLKEDYPGPNRAQYEFLLGLAGHRDEATDPSTPAPVAYDHFRSFIADHRGDRWLKDETRKKDVGLTYLVLAQRMTDEAEQGMDAAQLKPAAQALQDSVGWIPSSPDYEKLSERIDGIGVKIARTHHIDEFVRRVHGLGATVENVMEARRLARQDRIDGEASVKSVIAQKEDEALAAIHYTADPKGLLPPPKSPAETGFLVVPQLTAFATPVAERSKVVLALARGVVYGLDETTGEPRWARRVGIDTTTLPVAMPQTEFSPDLFLILSADRNLLTAVRAQNGTTWWEHQLSSPCLARPTIVGRMAYVPTYNGQVEEIETAQGRLVGSFSLGQHLTVGATWQEDTDCLYIPGDSEYLYILDLGGGGRTNVPVRPKGRISVLRTGHPSASLRSEPILISRVDPSLRAAGEQPQWHGYLILSQVDGVDHMKLRVFDLPVASRDASPALLPEPRLTGCAWFQPYHDYEKIALATDTGAFALFGIDQVRNDDSALFPQLSKEQTLGDSSGHLERAQVVHAVEKDFWVVANGMFQRFTYQQFVGQRLVRHRDWPTGLRVGSPLHAAQFDETHKTVFLVTQDAVRRMDLATAIDVETGKIRWQRQLGLEPTGEPLVLGSDVLVMDRSGGLVRFDPKIKDGSPAGEWHVTRSLAANPPEGAASATHVLPTADGSSLYQIVFSGQTDKLLLRHYQNTANGQHTLDEKIIEKWPAAIQGTPALGPKSVIVPLAKGTTWRISLPFEEGSGNGGPNWRTEYADVGAAGHVVQINEEEFLTTDGSRGVTHWKWPLKGTFSVVPEGTKAPTAQTAARIVSAPVVLPAAKPGDPLRVVVADHDGNLTLLVGDALKTERVWKLNGQVTSGPFARGERVGCVIDQRVLVWIDPAKAKPLWKFTMQGDGIVGQPRLVGKSILVADLSGKFVALDSDTGKQVGKEQTLAGSAAPMATPVAFDDAHALVSLTDGTVYLLPLKDFEEAKEAKR
jgi:outer membrane protein assembly factor BamB